MSTIMAIIKALYPVMILGFIVPVILCDSTLMSGKSNAIDDNTNNEITKFDKNLENLVPQYSVDHSLVDNSFISSLYQQEVCRRNMVNMVYELCRPYFRAVRRQVCANMLFPFKSMSKNDRRVCRQKSGETERKRNIQQLVGICCQEACSLQTLTKYCRPGSVSSPGTWPSSEGVPNTMLVDDRDDIFKLRLPLFRPPENVGQYVKK